jgi:nitrite reductase/ring-hydroxylating ferredoxin subunit
VTASKRGRPRWGQRPSKPAGPAVDLGLAEEVLAGGRGRFTVEPGEIPVLVVRTGRGLFAMRNRCPHRGLPLDDSTTRGRYLRCVFHQREFDLRSGACRSGAGPLITYRCWIDQGRLFVVVPGE